MPKKENHHLWKYWYQMFNIMKMWGPSQRSQLFVNQYRFLIFHSLLVWMKQCSQTEKFSQNKGFLAFSIIMCLQTRNPFQKTLSSAGAKYQPCKKGQKRRQPRGWQVEGLIKKMCLMAPKDGLDLELDISVSNLIMRKLIWSNYST